MSVERDEARQLDVVINGLWPPCRWSESSSFGSVALGALTGEYTLVFSYGNLRDRYRLTVAGDRVALMPEKQEFTWPRYTEWLRLPPDTIGFAAFGCERLPGAVAPDRARYDAAARAFFAGLEQLGATRATIPEGPYTNRMFIAPWPGWWASDGERTRVPIEIGGGGTSLLWPDIRYYRYTGGLDQLREYLRQQDAQPDACVNTWVKAIWNAP